MRVEELAESIIQDHLPMLQVSGVLSANEAYSRGSSLLTAQARLTNCWKQLVDELVKARAYEEQAMHMAISSAEGKDADARKASAKANPERQSAAERVALIENNIAYIQSFSRQFENAYRLYTYMVKGADIQI